MIRVILPILVLFFSCSRSNQHSKSKDGSKENRVDNYSDEFVISKILLDSLFLSKKESSAFSLQNVNISLSIGPLFDKEEKQAVLRYKENDSVSNVFVLQQKGDKWDTILNTKVFPSPTTNIDDSIVKISDFNGDNIPDLKVAKEFWAIHPGDYSSLWLYKNSHFAEVADYDKIISATYDKKTNLIYSYQSTGCSDMAMYFGIFRFEGNEIKKVKELYCDCCLATNDSCTIKVIGDKPYAVPYKTAYKHVPQFFAAGVKEKCELQ